MFERFIYLFLQTNFVIIIMNRNEYLIKKELEQVNNSPQIRLLFFRLSHIVKKNVI